MHSKHLVDPIHDTSCLTVGTVYGTQKRVAAESRYHGNCTHVYSLLAGIIAIAADMT